MFWNTTGYRVHESKSDRIMRKACMVVIGYLVVLSAIAILGTLSGCAASSSRLSQIKEEHDNLKQAASSLRLAKDDITSAGAEIEASNKAVQASNPELHEQTDKIATGVGTLKQAVGMLGTASEKLDAGAKGAQATSGDLQKANARIKELENANSGLLSRLLQGAAALGLLIAIVSFVWLHSFEGLLVGLAVFAGCVVGQWIIAYRVYIAVAGAIAAVGYGVWVIVLERYAHTKTIQTVEAIKQHVPDFKAIANGIQKQQWVRNLVDRIKQRFVPAT